MWRVFGAAISLSLCFGALFGGAAAAQQPVLVELYTSQGCNSCPPADAVLAKLAKREDVVALTLNVDYWDYLGWKDRFATPQHTARQRAYRPILGARAIYTPQMVIGGAEHTVGARRGEVDYMISHMAEKPKQADILIKRAGDALELSLTAPSAFDESATIWVFGYDGPHEEAIGRGENAGRTITYANVVRDMRILAEWDGAAPLTLSTPIKPGVKGYAVAVQKGRQGAVLAAAKLEF